MSEDEAVLHFRDVYLVRGSKASVDALSGELVSNFATIDRLHQEQRALKGSGEAAYAEIRRLQEELTAKNEVLGNIAHRDPNGLWAQHDALKILRRYPVNPQPPEDKT